MSAANTPARAARFGGSKGPDHARKWGCQTTRAVGEVTYTRSRELAIAVIRLKSPITVRSSGRQSRLGDCATAVTVAAADINTAPRVRIRGMYTSAVMRSGIDVQRVWGRESSSSTGG